MAPTNGWGLHVRLWDWEFATGKDMKEDISLPKTKCARERCKDMKEDISLPKTKCARERCWTICWSTTHGPNNISRQIQSLEDSWGPDGGQNTVGLIHKIVGVAAELMTMSDKNATDIQTHF